MENKQVVDWGQAAPTAPSIKRSDPLGWIGASLVVGALVGIAALAILWRELPLLGAPPWRLANQLSCGALAILRFAVHGAFGAEARACAAAWAAAPDAAQFGVHVREAIAFTMALAPSALFYRSLMVPRDNLIHMRGGTRLEGAAAGDALRARFGKSAKSRPDHEVAPGVPFPADMWTKHVLLVGGTGAGKSTFLRPLLSKVMSAGEPVLLFDPKGEFTANFPKPIILAPWDKRSHAWDIGRDMRNIADMRRFAEALVEQSTDPMWANASRQILVGCMAYLQGTRGIGNWGFQELADVVSQPQAQLASIMKKAMPEAARLVEKPTVTTQGILINLASCCAPIFDLAAAWGDMPQERRVSFVDWTLGKGRHKQIILQGHASYPALTRSFARPIVEVVSSLVSSSELTDDPKRKRWFICDECPALGRVNLRLMIEQGRSRGFRCVLACQDFAQLEELHGDKAVKALTSMVGTIVVGRIGPGDTAEQLAKAVGSREVERPNVSSSYAGAGGSSNRSTTLSFARDQLPIYLPSELASRLGVTPDETGVVMALVTHGCAHELFWPFCKLPKRRREHIPASWTLGVDPIGDGPGESPDGIGAGPAGRVMDEAKPVNDLQVDLERELLEPVAKPGEVVSEVVAEPTTRAEQAALESDASPSTDIAFAASWHDAGLADITGLTHWVHAADAVLDGRPGPAQEARLRQESPRAVSADPQPQQPQRRPRLGK